MKCLCNHSYTVISDHQPRHTTHNTFNQSQINNIMLEKYIYMTMIKYTKLLLVLSYIIYIYIYRICTTMLIINEMFNLCLSRNARVTVVMSDDRAIAWLTTFC